MTTGISDDRSNPPEPGAKPRRARSGVRLLIAILVSCGAIGWAGFSLWENTHPALAIARGLRAKDPDQRVAAIREVAALGPDQSPEAMHTLLPALKDPAPGVRTAAVQALSTVTSYAVQANSEQETVHAVADGLSGLLKDPDASVRRESANALVVLADVGAGNSRASGGRGKTKAAKPAGAAPRVIDQKSVVSALLEMFGDPDVEVQRAALLGVGNLASRQPGAPPQALFAALDDKSPLIREAAIYALIRFQSGLDPLVPVLFRLVAHDEPPVRTACTSALAHIQPSAITAAAIPLLIQGLQSREPDVREHSVSLLGRMSPDPRAAVPALIAVLRESDQSDQQRLAGQMATISYTGPAQEAAEALARIAPGTPAAGEAISALAEVVRSGPPRRRAAAAKALAQFGQAAAQAVNGLVAFLQDAEASKQTSEDGPSAARALGRIGPRNPGADQAVNALAAALKSSFSQTREAAIGAIGSFGEQAAKNATIIPTLRELNDKDPVPNVRRAAASALKELKAGLQ